jgi:hypothetical protein
MSKQLLVWGFFFMPPSYPDGTVVSYTYDAAGRINYAQDVMEMG